MPQKRKRYTNDFKARLALEALREQSTMSELASRHKVHPNLICQWKKHLIENAENTFTRGETNNKRQDDSLMESLYSEIGRLKMEVEFLKKTQNSFQRRSV